MKRYIRGYNAEAMKYPLASELEKIASRNGYYIPDCYVHDGRMYISIVPGNNYDEFVPAVNYNYSRKDGTYGFKVDVPAYGRLSVSELGEMLSQFTSVHDMCQEMESAVAEIGIVPGETVDEE